MEQRGASPLLNDVDLRISPSVDTASAANHDAIACLRRFFSNKMMKDGLTDCWYAPDTEQYGGVYSELLYAEYDSIGDLRYQPELMRSRAGWAALSGC